MTTVYVLMHHHWEDAWVRDVYADEADAEADVEKVACDNDEETHFHMTLDNVRVPAAECWHAVEHTDDCCWVVPYDVKGGAK